MVFDGDGLLILDDVNGYMCLRRCGSFFFFPSPSCGSLLIMVVCFGVACASFKYRKEW